MNEKETSFQVTHLAIFYGFPYWINTESADCEAVPVWEIYEPVAIGLANFMNWAAQAVNPMASPGFMFHPVKCVKRTVKHRFLGFWW